jgi:hypothetical protein
MMFERIFSWSMRHGSRLLFAASLLMLLAGIANLVLAGRMDSDWSSHVYNWLYGYVTPAAYLLFGAVLTDRLRRD